jgi:hypothetical protein
MNDWKDGLEDRVPEQFLLTTGIGGVFVGLPL